MSQKSLFGFAVQSKGIWPALRRVLSLGQRYGFTAQKIHRALIDFVNLTNQYNVYPTFPITGKVLVRHPAIAQYLHQSGVELAIHGWTHSAYNQMTSSQQKESIHRAQAAFANLNIPSPGFRSPYLSSNDTLMATLKETNFKYVSNRSIFWPVIEQNCYSSINWDSYQLAHTFYRSWSPDHYTTTPRLHGALVEIPVSLPDDEILIDRLGGTGEVVKEVWLAILERTYQQGGMFILQLHPERIHQCAEALNAVLETATQLSPSVWIARLFEIADWWQARTAAQTTVEAAPNNTWHLTVEGPPGLVWLAQDVTIHGHTSQSNQYQMIESPTLTVQSALRPFVGIAPGTPTALRLFLKEQGFLLEESTAPEKYGVYLDETNFTPTQEQPLLTKIEATKKPLIRLGRWPNGAQSVLSITGDIDALTIWDYVWRLFGR